MSANSPLHIPSAPSNNRKPALRGWFWLAVAVVFFGFLYAVKAILLPFVVGMLVAYLLDPAADKLEAKGFSRLSATCVITVGFFTLLGLGLFSLTPLLVSQISGLFAMLPNLAEEWQTHYASQWRWAIEQLGLTTLLHNALPAAADTANTASSNSSANGDLGAVTQFSGAILSWAGEVVRNVLHSGFAVLNVLSLLLITPVVTFYLLKDWDRLVAKIDGLLPRPQLATIRTQMREVDRTLAGFVRGQLTVCLLLGGYYALGLSLLGLSFGVVIGLLTGVLTIIPYVGMLFGAGLGLVLAWFQWGEWGMLGAVLAVFVTGQFIEGNFVTPKLVGEKVGLHAVWIMFGMLSGGALFGFVGVLLAVPVTAVIGVWVRFALSQYLASPYYTGLDKAAPPPSPPQA